MGKTGDNTMAKVKIIIQGGAVVDVEKPDYVEVVIQDFDTDGVDETVLQKDSDGDEYQEFVFPVETKPVEVDEPYTMTNFYKCEHCNTEWQDEYSCACDDDCPKCGVTHSPYKSEDFE